MTVSYSGIALRTVEAGLVVLDVALLPAGAQVAEATKKNKTRNEFLIMVFKLLVLAVAGLVLRFKGEQKG